MHVEKKDACYVVPIKLQDAVPEALPRHIAKEKAKINYCLEAGQPTHLSFLKEAIPAICLYLSKK